MIRGTTTQFRFEMPHLVNTYSTIEAVFWQEGNENDGLPIIKYYNRHITGIDTWSAEDKDIRKIYQSEDDSMYHRYNGEDWVDSATEPEPINSGFIFNADEPHIIGVPLDADETALFTDTIKAHAQIRAHSVTDGVRVASKEQRFTVYPTYRTDELGDNSRIAPTPVVSGTVVLDSGNIS